MADHGLRDNVALVVHLKPVVRQQYGETAGGDAASQQGGAQGGARRRGGGDGGGKDGEGSSDMELDVGVEVQVGAAAGWEGGGGGEGSGGEVSAAEAAVAAMLGRPVAAGAQERRSSGSKRLRSGGPQSQEDASLPQQGQQQGQQQQQPVLDRRFRPPYAAAGAFPAVPGHQEQGEGGATEEGVDGGRARSRSRSRGRGMSRGREGEEAGGEGPGVLVANTHILFNTKRGDVKLGQVGNGLNTAWVGSTSTQRPQPRGTINRPAQVVMRRRRHRRGIHCKMHARDRL